MFTSNQRARHLSIVPVHFAPLSRPRMPADLAPQLASLHEDADLAPMTPAPRPLIAGGQGRGHVWPTDIAPAPESPPRVLDRGTDCFDPDAGMEPGLGGGGAFGACMFFLGALAGAAVVGLLALFGRD